MYVCVFSDANECQGWCEDSWSLNVLFSSWLSSMLNFSVGYRHCEPSIGLQLADLQHGHICVCVVYSPKRHFVPWQIASFSMYLSRESDEFVREPSRWMDWCGGCEISQRNRVWHPAQPSGDSRRIRVAAAAPANWISMCITAAKG